MRNKIKYLFRLLSIILIIFIVLELSLGVIFDYNDNKRHNQNTEIKIKSGAYENIDPKTIKEIYDELHILDSQWEPYVHFRLKAFEGKHTNIDKNGIRSTLNINLKDSLNPIKIFCFGGSTMLSTGARDHNTIPSELSKLIHNSYPNLNTEITNFGCLGYNRSIENIQLQQQLLQGNIPNIVIFYDGVNEVISAYQNNKAGTPTNAINRENEFMLAHNYSKRIKLFFTSSNINRLITYLQRRIFKTKSFEVKQPEKLANDIASNYLNNIKITDAIAQNYNFETFNFLQPVIYTKAKLTSVEQVYADKDNFYNDLYTKSYTYINQDSTITRDNAFMDISNVFDATNETIYTDFCHTGEYGNTLVAKRLFNVIEEAIILKSRTENIQKEPVQSSQ